MIVKFKIFENKSPEPGDYVVVNVTNDSSIAKLLNNKIGKIENIENSNSYIIRFGTISFNIKKEDILDFSDTKEKLEPYIRANKYNL